MAINFVQFARLKENNLLTFVSEYDFDNYLSFLQSMRERKVQNHLLHFGIGFSLSIKPYWLEIFEEDPEGDCGKTALEFIFYEIARVKNLGCRCY